MTEKTTSQPKVETSPLMTQNLQGKLISYDEKSATLEISGVTEKITLNRIDGDDTAFEGLKGKTLTLAVNGELKEGAVKATKVRSGNGCNEAPARKYL